MNVLEKVAPRGALCRCGQCGDEYSVKCLASARKSSVGAICTKCSKAITGMKEPDQELLNQAFQYDPETGSLQYRNLSASGKAGECATHLHSRGYLNVSIGRKQYLAHRVIYLMMKGEWPEFIDHINHCRTDNRWENLRNVTQEDNNRNMSAQQNSTTGVVGVSLHKPTGKFRAYISINSRAKHLGLFDTLEAAKAARDEASGKAGYHLNHGKQGQE